MRYNCLSVLLEVSTGSTCCNVRWCSGLVGSEAAGESGREAAASSSSSRKEGDTAHFALLCTFTGGVVIGGSLLRAAMSWAVTMGCRGVREGLSTGPAGVSASSTASCMSSTDPPARRKKSAVKCLFAQSGACYIIINHSSDAHVLYIVEVSLGFWEGTCKGA